MLDMVITIPVGMRTREESGAGGKPSIERLLKSPTK